MLLNKMQTHPDIACGFYKGSKEELNRVWRNLEKELNSAGPPSKNVSEWKKVWADQKKYVRHKASQNLKAIKGTGGGPNIERKLSATEETIYHLVGMKDSVEGVAKRFGLDSSVIAAQTPENIGSALDLLLVDDVVEKNDEKIDEETPPHQPPAKKRKTDLPTQKVSPTDALAEELLIQKDISEAMKAQQQNIKKVYRSIDRLYDLQQDHFKTTEKDRKDELEELKRHNSVMEKLRVREVEDKIEKNRRLLELEDLRHKY